MEAIAGLGKRRLMVGAVAVVAILFGLALAGGTTQVKPTAPIDKVASPAPAGSGQDQTQSYLVRDYPELEENQGIDTPLDLGGSLGSFVVKLLLVVALAYGTILALKRYVFRGSAVLPGKDGKAISLLSSLDLSPNRTIYLIEIGKKVLVVGGTQTNLSLLAEITDLEGIAEVQATSGQSTESSFSSLLEKAKSHLRSSAASAGSEWTAGALAPVLNEGRLFVGDRREVLRRSTTRD